VPRFHRRLTPQAKAVLEDPEVPAAQVGQGALLHPSPPAARPPRALPSAPVHILLRKRKAQPQPRSATRQYWGERFGGRMAGRSCGGAWLTSACSFRELITFVLRARAGRTPGALFLLIRGDRGSISRMGAVSVGGPSDLMGR
jgi:hypothetical protein